MAGVLCSMVGASFVTAVAEVIRRKKSLDAVNGAQVDIAQSKFGGASLLLDGTNDYLQVGYDSDFAFGTGDFTIEFWTRLAANINTKIFYDQRPLSTSGAYPTIYHNNGTIYYFVNNANRITGSGLATNTWYHIAVCRASGSTRMFVDGTQVGSTYSDNNNYLVASTGVRIGSDQNDPGASNYISGWIDEIRVSRSARYTSNFTAPSAPFTNDANTVLLVHCNGTDASTFFEDDNGVRAQRGVIASGNAQVDNAQSKFGGTSAVFDGSDDRLALLNPNINFGTGNFTIEMWFRTTARTQNYPNLINNYGDDALFQANVWGLFDRHDNVNTKLTYWVYNISNSSPVLTSSTSISNGTWYHVAIVRNGTNFKMYLNGIEESSSTSSQSIDNNANKNLYIGWTNTGSSYNGHIDELRISNTARYTANFTPATEPFSNDANTLVLLHMDGTDGSTVFRDDNGVRAPKGIYALGNAQIDTAQSKFGGASALFDGNGDYLTIQKSSDLSLTNSQSFTIECWFRVPNTTGTKVLLSSFSAGSPFNGWSIEVEGQQPKFWNGSAFTNFNTNVVSTNTWYHLAVVSSSGSIKFYFDGVQQTNTTSLGSGFNNSTTPVYVGAVDGISRVMDGWIDEVRISSIARYTANFTPATEPFSNDANTLLLLHMDGTDASTVIFDDNGQVPQTP